MILPAMAWRNIWRNRKRTLILICAIVAGLVGVQFSMGNINGWMDELVHSAVRNYEGHIKISTPAFQTNPSVETTFSPDRDLTNLLEKESRISGWAPRVLVSGMASVAEHSTIVEIIGIDPAREASASILKSAVVDGRYLNADETGTLLIGKRLAERFETKVGRKVVLMSQQASGEIGSAVFRIAGLYDTGLGSFDESTVYVLNSDAQAMLGLGDHLSEISVKVRDMRDADAVRNRLAPSLPAKNLSAQTWNERLPFILQTIRITKRFMWIYYLMFYLAMAFGIVNTLLIAIGERTHEIGVMLAIGMNRRRIVFLILAESLCIAAIALVVGLVLGGALVALLHGIGINLSHFAEGTQWMGVSHIIYPHLGWTDAATAAASTVVICVFFSFYPAWHASRLIPVEAMRK